MASLAECGRSKVKGQNKSKVKGQNRRNLEKMSRPRLDSATILAQASSASPVELSQVSGPLCMSEDCAMTNPTKLSPLHPQRFLVRRQSALFAHAVHLGVDRGDDRLGFSQTSDLNDIRPCVQPDGQARADQMRQPRPALQLHAGPQRC